jgi:GxxExxY protein
MIQDELIFRLIQCARKVHGSLGPGFVESIYGRAMISELKSTGLMVEREKLIRVTYGDVVVGRHWLDLVVEETVILELKANRGILPVHVAQVRSYLHATRYPSGMILNFGMPDLQWEKVESDTGRISAQ